VIHWKPSGVRDRWRGEFAGHVVFTLEAHRPTPSQAVWALYFGEGTDKRGATFMTRRAAKEWAEEHLWASTAKM
jgi:hypothetical protein